MLPEDKNIEKPEKNLDQIKRLVRATYNNLERISHLVDKMEQDEKKEIYKSLPGVEGYFDGFQLVGDDGKKYDIPANYAAKSRLVFGDRLKLIEEVGGRVFKQIEKVDRKLIEGVLSKKEGKWYLLSDSGSYKISDTAAEFNKAVLNEKAVAFIPSNNPSVSFAALDKILRPEEVNRPYPVAPRAPRPVPNRVEAMPAPAVSSPSVSSPAPAPNPEVKRPVRSSTRSSVRSAAPSAPVPQPAPQPPAAPAPAPKPITTSSIALDDDDLR